MIDFIIFSIVMTKLDIVFATSIASCFVKNSGYQHIEAVKTILQYFKVSKNQKIIYGSQDKLFIEGYSNFN